ncbi:dipeptidyl-peptidase and tripeptidyl-peptidase [Moniliophthora roreri MCA 2997]|uniref:Dipeptidyl-peptidase and tripeptidyl-peptidase n=1 Tax=Moniliophthora roreri (strain MCA 2997) TaxID=1381753 RepID=V2WXT0_MONRO|nr:dipeptidyl-peptidase and tripeptidyl-peptidase [Moniliophthora roreri MCA 2997]
MQGFNHIALFSPPDSGECKWITQGEWEVVGGVKGVDEERGAVYFEFHKTKFHQEVRGYLGKKVLSTKDSDWEYVLNMNEALARITREYESPTIAHGSITIDGYNLNTMEL